MGSIPVANPSPPRRLRLRRSLLFLLLLPSAALLALVVLLAFAWPERSDGQRSPWVGAADFQALSVNQPLAVPDLRVYLVKQPSGEVLALLRRSPYKGCTIVWRPDFVFNRKTGWFRDPCHSGTFDLAGVCFAPQCPRGMDRFQTKIEDGRVLVNTKVVQEGPPRVFASPSPASRPPRYTP